MTEEASRLIEKALAEGRGSLMEPEAKELCRLYGIPTTRFLFARTEEEALRCAEEIGYPIALKVVSPDVLHKSDVGGVFLGIRNSWELKKGYEEILANVRLRSPSARIEGLLVEEMAEPSVELILGALRDPHFGPAVMFGLGGTFVEALGDVSFRVAPLSREDALEMMMEVRGFRILKGFRGGEPKDLQALSEALLGVSKLITEHPEIDQVDLNPVFAYPKGCRVVDARVTLRGPGAMSIEAPSENGGLSHRQLFEGLDRLFSPGSVAVLGASPTPGRIGYGVIASLVGAGFQGKVYPVNPKYTEVLGLRCYRSLRDVPGNVDLAVMVIPASALPGAVSECVEKGVGAVLVISGGFKELGGEQAEVEKKVAKVLKSHGIRLIGPNCMGILNPQARLDALFQVPERMLRPGPGRIAFLTQSGTFGCAFLEWAALEGLGISKFVSYGNRADLDEADLIRYLGEDRDTEVIALYVEGIGNGRRLLEAFREVSPRKPILVLKAGRTEEGSKVALSHTGNLAGSYALFRGALHQGGALEARSLRELFAMVKALTLQPKAGGSRMAMVTNGAGPCVIVADGLEESGLSLASLSGETLNALRERLPAYCIPGNPVDLTGSARAEDYANAIGALLSDPGVDMVASFFVFQDTPLEEVVVEKVSGLQSHRKPIIAWASGGPFTARQSRRLQALGIPVFETPEEVLAAVRALATQGCQPGRAYRSPEPSRLHIPPRVS